LDTVREKLTRCFTLALPDLDPALIPKARAENVAAWDSVTQVTLLSLIGEEFGIEPDFTEFAGATSFEALAILVSGIVARA